MITINNFHQGTSGEFKIAKTYNVEKRLKSKGYIMVGDCEKLINKLVSRDFKEFKNVYNSNSSFYFFNEKTNELLRVSNHWSKRKNPWSFIRTCYWTLNKESKDKPYTYKCGIINLDNLKTNN